MTTEVRPGEAARIAREGALYEALYLARDMRLAQDRHFLNPTTAGRAAVRELEMQFDRKLAVLLRPAPLGGASC